MKRVMLLLAMVLPAVAGQGQTVDVCDRTAQVRDAIVEALDTNDCATVDSEELADIETLNLESKQLTALLAGDFDGLDSLTTLNLNRNQLTALPDGVFDGPDNLTTLSLNHNQLTALSDSVFDGLDRLQTLRLGTNQLTTLPNGAFDGLGRLQTLILGVNQLTALPDGAFDGLDSLQTLLLSENQLTTLPDGVFDGLDSLQMLWLGENQLTALPDGVFDGLDSLQTLRLSENQLTTLPDGAFDGLIRLRRLDLNDNRLTTLPALPDSVFDGLVNLQTLSLNRNQLTALPDGMFDDLAGLHYLELDDNRLTALSDGAFGGLIRLRTLSLNDNQLAALSDSVFDGLDSLQWLYLNGNQLILTDGVFDELGSLQWLWLRDNQLTTLPDGVFDGLDSLRGLYLHDNQLATLPDGAFDRLVSLQGLYLHGNQLTALPDGVFGGLVNLQWLWLRDNQLTTLPDGVFDGLVSLRGLYLHGNQLATLPGGAFNELDSLIWLHLNDNRLTTLPDGVFDGLDRLQMLDLRDNHLVGLTRDDPLFAVFSGSVDIQLSGQTQAPQTETPSPTRLAAAVPLMLSSSDSMRQGFVRLVNASDESGSVRVFAFDDGGHAPDPIEMPLGAGQAVHFNSNDLEDGNPNKGVASGVGGPVRGDWRLDVETALAARVLAFVRHSDGFLTAMHDVLPRAADRRIAAHTFNPGSNTNQASKLRLVNTGSNHESVRINGVDDRGEQAGPMYLTLAAGESRTLSAFDLENGAQGLTETLGDGAGKWRLFIAAGNDVVGMSLLESASGHLTNLSTAGVAIETARRAAAVPLLLSASDPARQGFVRVVNESNVSGVVRVFAFDDGGHAPDPLEIRLGAGQAVHFNSNDLEDGNPNKGIESGVGGPVRGDWRLDVETALTVRVLAFVRHGDGFLTAMHDVLRRGADGRLAAHTFNPGGNLNQASRLRLVNTGANDENVIIDGVDDQGNNAGPVTLTLAAGESRTLSAADLENEAHGLTGTLGEGAGKWRLFLDAGRSVVAMSLLESASGHLTNISTMGVSTDSQ